MIDAYSTASIKERSPEVHLFIEMPPDALDVNVHPTKAEVRFREQSLVHEVVRRAFMDALGQGGVPQLQLRPEVNGATPAPSPRRCRACWPAARIPNRWVPGAAVVISHGYADPRSAAPPVKERRRHGAPDEMSQARAAGAVTALDQRCGRSSRSASFATRSSSPSTTKGWRSSISTSRTSACCSSASWSG